MSSKTRDSGGPDFTMSPVTVLEQIQKMLKQLKLTGAIYFQKQHYGIWDLELERVPQSKKCQYKLGPPHKNNLIRIVPGGALAIWNNCGYAVEVTLPKGVFPAKRVTVASKTGVVMHASATTPKGKKGGISIPCLGNGGGPDLEVGDP